MNPFPGSSLRIVVTGLIAQYPLGGVAWDYAQYPAGLAELGHDVYYVEDTGQWPYNPEEGGTGSTPTFNVEYLRRLMAGFGLADRWAYRFPWENQWFGMTERRVDELVASADLVINVSGSLGRPDRYRGRGRLVYIDTDPVFTQVKVAKGQADIRSAIDAHDATFSFGETLPEALKGDGHDWLPTRQPVLLDRWVDGAGGGDAFTTVMNWTSYKPIEWNGGTLGQKDGELTRFLELPSMADPPLEIALAAGKTKRPPIDLLRHKGWRVVDPDVVCPDVERYRSYIVRSRGEWSVAKGGYVAGRSGWFSCRSACYLAAGRPVIVQDTGFSAVLPVGRGLLAFDDVEGAAAAIDAVEGDYRSHSIAARAIAHEWFDSRRVLGDLLDRTFAAPTPAEAKGDG